MTYVEALEYISASGRFGIKLGLERVRALLDALGSPDAGMQGVLVGGTNGKGSTCAYLVSILNAAGYRVGSMPKPHLHSYTERICVDGVPIGEDDFARLITGICPVVEEVARELGPPTEFEMLTAAAIRYLRAAEIDWLVCEVGLGGSLDATNVLDLGVKVITSVDLDHQQYLGPDRTAIAEQKAGIIKPLDVVITGGLNPDAAAVVRRRADAAGAELWELGQSLEMHVDGSGWRGSKFHVLAPPDPDVMRNLQTPLLGEYQAENAALAIAAAYAMHLRWQARLGRGDIRKGLRGTRWPGRLELVQGKPRVLIDSAHNPAALERVVDAVGGLLADGNGARASSPGRPPVVVFGAMADKDATAMLRLLPREWPAVHTAVAEERARPAEELLAAAQAMGRTGDRAVAGVPEALAAARSAAGPQGLVLVLGSLYLAGAARTALGLQ